MNQSNCSIELVNQSNSYNLLDCSNRVLGLRLVSKDYKICGPNSLTRIIQSYLINQLLLKFVDLSSRSLVGGRGLDAGEYYFNQFLSKQSLKNFVFASGGHLSINYVPSILLLQSKFWSSCGPINQNYLINYSINLPSPWFSLCGSSFKQVIKILLNNQFCITPTLCFCTCLPSSISFNLVKNVPKDILLSRRYHLILIH